MPDPGATEAKPVVIQREHLVAAAGIDKGKAASPVKDAAQSFVAAVNEQGGSAKKAKRALEAIGGGERKASYDGRDPVDTLNGITDEKVKKNVEQRITMARTEMAAIDVLRLSDPDARTARLKVLQAEGKIPKGIKTVDDLVKKAAGYIASEEYFKNYFKDYDFTGTTPEQVAQAMFLEGAMADQVHVGLSEQVGLLQKAVLELPKVPGLQKDVMLRDLQIAEAMRDGAEASILAEIQKAANAGQPLTPEQTVALTAAAGQLSPELRRQDLTRVVAGIAGVDSDGMRVIAQQEEDQKRLSKLKLERNDGNKDAIAQLEGDMGKRRQENADVFAKYEKAVAIVSQPDVDTIAGVYADNRRAALMKNLELKGTALQPEITSDEAKARALEEQNLEGQAQFMTADALNSAIIDRTKELSAGALQTAEEEAVKAEKEKNDELVDLLTAYKDSLRKGNKSYFETDIKKGLNGSKDVQTETLHINNLAGAMEVVATYDTPLGPDGTDFMIAYHAGLIDKAPIMQNGAIPNVDVVKELAELRKDEAKARKLASLCTPEMRTAFRGHLFAEYSRAQRYIDAGGVFGADWVRKMKGIDVKIDGNPSAMKLTTNTMDKIFGMHEAEIQTAIDKSHDAQAFIQQLKGEGWITADRKTKNILYAIMMILGLVAVPGAIALAPGVAAVGGLGVAAEAAGGAIAGGFAAKKVAESTS